MSTLFLLAGAFAAGCGLGVYLPIPLPLCPPVVGGLVALIAIGRKFRRLFLACAVISATAVGWLRSPPLSDNTPPPLEVVCHRIVEGALTAPPLDLGGERRLTVEIARVSPCLTGPAIGALEPGTGRLYLSVATGEIPFERGESIRVRTLVKPLVPRRNPGDTDAPPEAPMYTGAIKSTAMMVRVKTAHLSIRHPFDRFRMRLSAAIAAALPARTAAMAKALCLGERHLLPADMISSFRRTGAAHLLSVSGLHLGLTCLFVFGVLRFVLLRTGSSVHRDVGGIAALCTIPFAVSFALLTGLRPPVVRAAVMASSALAARAVGRGNAALEAMGLAAVILLAAAPTTLFSPGFQLSFAAIIGFLVTFRIRRHDETRTMFKTDRTEKSEPDSLLDPVLRWGHALLVTSLAAASATAPLLLYHFHAVSLLAVGVNLFAVPLTGFVVMPLLLAAIALYPVSETLFAAVLFAAEPFLTLLDRSLGALATLPWVVDHPGPVLTVGILVLSMAGLLLAAGRHRQAAFFLAVALMVSGLSLCLDPEKVPPGKMTVHFLDVGQGDSALITAPNGAHLLIDAGGAFEDRFNAGQEAVIPALRALGVDTLEALVITHPDQDHAGGAAAVLRALDVKSLWETGHGAHLGIEGGYRDALDFARTHGIEIARTPRLCGETSFGKMTVNVLYPCTAPEGYDKRLSTNDNAIVLAARFGRIRFLFMGDVGAPVEASLIAAGAHLAGDIVKVGHHGSHFATTDRFLDVSRPGVAVISASPFNRFHLPSDAVLQRLAHRGIQTLRTDVDGAVTITTDGRLIAINRAAPEGKYLPRPPKESPSDE